MNCKDCLHFDVCLLGARVNGATGTCQNYKDKSEWVHLPRKKGDVEDADKALEDMRKEKTMNKSNDMQIKKVFSPAKYLSDMMKICYDDTEIQGLIIPAINPKGWVWECDGKTPKECRVIGFGIVDEWCIEIPQNENIDFWRKV